LALEPPFVYNLNINCVDGSTIYGMISYDRRALLNFLRAYDHEGSGIHMVRRNYVTDDRDDFSGGMVYTELEIGGF
jgi:hypothetical protein